MPPSIQHRLPGHEQETFKPKINPRSKAVNRGDSRNVYSRLYESATKSIAARKAVQSEKARKYINTDVDEANGLSLGVSFRVDLDLASRPPMPKSAPTPSTAPDYFNVVAYDPKFDFIVRRLNIAAAE